MPMTVGKPHRQVEHTTQGHTEVSVVQAAAICGTHNPAAHRGLAATNSLHAHHSALLIDGSVATKHADVQRPTPCSARRL